MSDKKPPLMPTAKMLEAGIRELKESVDEYAFNDEEWSDLACFVWQAMYGAAE